jgi:nitrogen fixation-related uncharacterized protein
MDKKYLIGAGIVIIILIGLFFWWSGKNKSGQPESAKQEETTETATQKQQEKPESKIGGITDWLSSLSGGKALSCTYNFDESGKAGAVKINMMGKKYRSEFEAGGMKFTSVFDGTTLYSWSDSQKQGTKMDMDCMEQLKTQTEAQAQPNSPSQSQYEKSPEDFLKNQPNIQCEPSSGAADFSVPSNVQFTDSCAMMQKSLEMMQQYKDKIPGGLPQ